MTTKISASANQATISVGTQPVANLTAGSGIAFCKNKLLNGEVTRINQRGFNGNWTPLSVGAYGYDRWKKAAASNISQVIEAGNFRPSTIHTLSGNNVTTQQITSPASGNWTITVSNTATNVQVEEGETATPFEIRPISFELAQCQRYYETFLLYLAGNIVSGGNLGASYPYKVVKRVSPFMTLIANTSGNLGSPNASNGDASSALIYAPGATVGNATLNVQYSADAEIP